MSETNGDVKMTLAQAIDALKAEVARALRESGPDEGGVEVRIDEVEAEFMVAVSVGPDGTPQLVLAGPEDPPMHRVEIELEGKLRKKK
ncbi:MAG: trypco2 family protein [Myxococcota bacterium]